MAVREITYEERDKMYDQALKKMGIEMRHPSREELEKEIIDYLSKKQPCSLATCGKDGWPRVSVVDYINDGLTIYIFSEGGDKFKNLKENSRVGIGIF
jgi:nitroimidazol reductase NimA-like FMN-containing flavoprotein (pyridoxamine 5'-phosphate oxidase superfamily)